jgi:sortase A
MKMVIRGELTRRLLRWSPLVLTGLASIAFGYVLMEVIGSWLFQDRSSVILLHSPHRALPLPLRPGDLLGRLEIPSIGLSAVVVHGISPHNLSVAVGHIPGTTLPGQPGNIGFAAHRDTFFRPLRQIHTNDTISIQTLTGYFTYRVRSIRIVRPTEVWVLDPTPTETLTLITCHPFHFIGAAPNRFIVTADRIHPSP